MAQQHLKFAIFGNEYQAKKSASIMRILSYLDKKDAEVSSLLHVLHFALKL